MITILSGHQYKRDSFSRENHVNQRDFFIDIFDISGDDFIFRCPNCLPWYRTVNGTSKVCHGDTHTHTHTLVNTHQLPLH